jgi:hypothetical protein
VDIKRLIGEVAARHGVVLKESDPIFLTVTLNQLVLEEYVKLIEDAARDGDSTTPRRLSSMRSEWGWAALGAMAAALVVFGGLCVRIGMQIGAASPATKEGIVSAILRAPAGWMAFLFLVPVAVRFGRWGWEIAKESAMWQRKVLGWGMIVLSSAGSVASASILWLLMS